MLLFEFDRHGVSQMRFVRDAERAFKVADFFKVV